MRKKQKTKNKHNADMPKKKHTHTTCSQTRRWISETDRVSNGFLPLAM